MLTPTALNLFWVYSWPILFAEHESFIRQTLCLRDKPNISYLCLYWKSPCVSSVTSFQQYSLSSGTVQCLARVWLPPIHYKAFFLMLLVYLPWTCFGFLFPVISTAFLLLLWMILRTRTVVVLFEKH